MSQIIVYIVVFALAGGFFWWLRRIGRRMAPPSAAPDAGGDDGALADNLEFVADRAVRLLQRKPGDGAKDRDDAGASDGGGDGG